MPVLTPNQDDLELLKATTEELNLRLLRAQVQRAEGLAALTQRRLAQQDAERAPVYEFFTDTDEEYVSTCIAVLGTWSRRQPNCAIEIILNSPGGTVSGGMALYEYLVWLRQLGHPITITVLGMAASMAGVILQAADLRRIAANCWFMMHEVASSELGKVSEMKDGLETTTRMQDQLVTILSRRSMEKPGGLTSEKIQEMWRKTDVWLDADQALAFHLVDEIINVPAAGAPKPQTTTTRAATGRKSATAIKKVGGDAAAK